MRAFKRNAVIVTVIVFVCVAVYLNWSYARTEALAKSNEDTEREEQTEEITETETGGLYYVEDSSDTETVSAASEYFDQVRLSREQARDSAVATLKTVTETSNADQKTVDEAMAAMVEMAKRTEEEARLESLIIAKGFEDCVAYMQDGGITVTVASGIDGLSNTAVARIKDIVLTETAYTADQLKIIEIR